jgi:hypothetical protein
MRFIGRMAVGLLMPLALCHAADPASQKMTWVNLNPATPPPARSGPGMTYDPVQKLVVLFGGIGDSNKYLNDTWTFNGVTWTEQDPTTAPPPRQQPGMAYDFAAKQVVLFAGIGRGGDLLDTWTWNGSDWTQLTTATNPGPCSGDGALYDPQLKGVILPTWKTDG